MSEFSLILVLQKNKRIRRQTWRRYKLNLRDSLLLGNYFWVIEQFDSTLSSVIDSTLGLRCRSFHFMARFLAIAENTVFLLLTALIRNFYKVIIQRLDVKKFGLNATSRIKAFVFSFISVPAKWIRTSRRYVLNIYTCNNAYADAFQTDFG